MSKLTKDHPEYRDMPTWLVKADIHLNELHDKHDCQYILLSMRKDPENHGARVLIHLDEFALAGGVLGSAYIKVCEAAGKDPLTCFVNLLDSRRRQERGDE